MEMASFQGPGIDPHKAHILRSCPSACAPREADDSVCTVSTCCLPQSDSRSAPRSTGRGDGDDQEDVFLKHWMEEFCEMISSTLTGASGFYLIVHHCGPG